MPGKATAWLENLNTDLNKVADAMKDVQNMHAAGMSKAIATGLTSTFKGHQTTLRDLRGTMEQIKDGQARGTDRCERHLGEARNSILALKRDCKALASCKKQYLKKATSAENATYAG